MNDSLENSGTQDSSAARFELPEKLYGVEFFDYLKPHEYESLFLRTNATLDEIKQSYDQLQRTTINLKAVFQFALNPQCWTEIDPRDWGAVVGQDEVILVERKANGRISFVHDRPTLQLLKLFSEEIRSLKWKPRLGDQLPEGEVLTAADIYNRFRIPRSTIEGWENVGVPTAKLARLQFDTDRHDRHTYIFKDLKPFIDHLYSRKSDLNAIP